MGCGSSVEGVQSMGQGMGQGGPARVPFHPELAPFGDGPDEVLDMRAKPSPVPPAETAYSSPDSGAAAEGNFQYGGVGSESDEGEPLSPRAMLEAALAYRPSISLDEHISLLSNQLRLYPAYMPENEACEIVDQEVAHMGHSEELTQFESEGGTASMRDCSTWRSPASESGSGMGSILQFNRPPTPSGVITSEPSPVSQFFRQTLSSFKARLTYSDDEGATGPEAAPKYLLSPGRGTAADEEVDSLPLHVVMSPLSKSLTPRRAAEQNAISTLRHVRCKGVSESNRVTFERIRAWSELNLMFLFGTPPQDVAGQTVSKSMSLDSPVSSRRKPKKPHLSSSTLDTLQSLIKNSTDTSQLADEGVHTLAGVVAWYYGTAPLRVNSSTPEQQQLAKLNPPCILEHLNHPVYGYSVDSGTDAEKNVTANLGRVMREFNASLSRNVDVIITAV